MYFASKMNIEIGGFNYAVVPESFARNLWIAGGDTLVVGYDVSHPGKPSREEIMSCTPPQKPSVVGVEGHVLNSLFKWMLGLFSRHRGVWPRRVVITRDGVSEGQHKMVIGEELNAIKEACEEFARMNGDESWMPLFTVIITTKRHNARFFVRSGSELFVSGTFLQGTARPTSYQVIVDENEMSSDELQSLMLALTFHHQISNAPVSLPEPIYQADEWAKRGKDIWKAYT
ncbi:unnamed protein product [Strongylus vulgaris]|uniref:Piwi domain-containing protein n=1 Tax=Strongylus vulgaris TaxID=40348 RepID=A0A3P7IBT1_STRVU|nr:unnamed protein product [Strongylus vulgaris]